MKQKSRPLPPFQVLDGLFTLKGDELVWNSRPPTEFRSDRLCVAWNKRCAGKSAGTQNNGYRKVKIGGLVYKAHRVIYALRHRTLPPVDMLIDHIDGNGLNNSAENLRLVSETVNNRNRTRLNKNNKSGTSGVAWNKRKNCWYVTVKVESGKTESVGLFKDLEQATLAAKQARDAYHARTCHHA